MTHANCLCVLVLLGAAAPALAQDAKPYTLEDLTALAEQESWPELLAHLEDIAPRARKKPWNDLLERAAIGHVTSIAAMEEKYGALMTAEAFLVQYPPLKKAATYMKKRAEVGLSAFDQCFAGGAYAAGDCSERLLAFVKVDAKNTELAFAAGKLTRVKGGWGPAMMMFDLALQKGPKPEQCQDEQLLLALTSSLGTPPGDLADAAKRVAFGPCFKHLQAPLVAALAAEGGYLPQTVCPELLKKKALSKFQTAYCQDQLAKK